MTADTQIASPDILSLHRRALQSTRQFVAGIGPRAWTDATPCDDWDVRALLNHVVVGNLWAAELVVGHTIEDVGNRLDGDRLGAAPLDAYDESAEAAARAFETPGALDAPCAVSYGPVPGRVYAGHRFIDVLIHGWDLGVATSTDANPRLDPDLIEGCWAVLDPQLDDLKASGMFGSAPSGPAASDPQIRLLQALGRITADS